MQQSPSDMFLNFLNSKANSLANGLSDLAANANKFVSNSSLSAPNYSNGSLSSGDSTGTLIFGGICIVALVVFGGIVIASLSKKC